MVCNFRKAALTTGSLRCLSGNPATAGEKDVLSFPRTLTIVYADYREVGGEIIPFKKTSTHGVSIADSE